MRPNHSLKGKLRRASLSLVRGIVHCRDRRGSEPGSSAHDHHTPARPTTAHSAWHKLRQATTFRHSRSAHGSRSGLGTIYSPMSSTFPDVPVPGNGLEPPIIPHHTGAGAKAAVAAFQNHNFAFQQRLEWLSEESQNDRESGIGIAVASASELELSNAAMTEDSSVTRVDFISQLPLELAVQILAHLDARDLAVATRASKVWYEIAQDQHIWRQSFLREKTTTFATSESIQPGVGLGIPAIQPENDWQKIYRAKHELERKWKEGNRARPIYLNGHLDSIYCLQFDESKIITGSRDKTIRIWDMHTFQCRLVIGPPEVVNDTSILFDPNGQPVHYAVVPEDDRAHQSVPATVSFPTHHKASILCLQYDDGILVTGSSDSSCIVYNMKSGYRPIRRLQYHTAAVLDLAFDDKHIVTCSKDISICVWDRNTGALLKQLKGHTGPVNAVQMRGNTIVSCSGDFMVKLWNIDSGRIIREFAGHTKGLACSQFSEDGRYIASAGSDKLIRVWDANTGECIREMQAHDSLVRSLHIDSVSGRLISGSYDTDIKVFDMESGDQLLDFPRWHASWVLSAKSDYRRIVSTGQDPKILIMDFGAEVEDIEMLESAPKADVARAAGFI
ncbi:WD40-repeat-containing domain protein [Pseudomassariella vexata]|uniref:WD40-repeat-containing domain protein n=1 Tax=Pseudomassariella vexata TaxID=1141098 RepID=A0A1Y2DVR9_9PEZI|nr:WD40-repeat-containing domain protein [Pseudomassariella vexata]ORY63392.1 WD40-repeat-containing domain protein [Pseudomassariella vexata]